MAGVENAVGAIAIITKEIFEMIKAHKQLAKTVTELQKTLVLVDHLASTRGKAFEDSPIQQELIISLTNAKSVIEHAIEERKKKKKSSLVKIKKVAYAKDDLERIQLIEKEIRARLDLMEKENVQHTEENTRFTADTVKKLLANSERFIKNAEARPFWEDNFPTMLDVELSLFRGAFRAALKESLKDNFPEKDFSAVFDKIRETLDEDGSGSISIYEYNEFTLDYDVISRFSIFHDQYVSERIRILQEEEERKREEEAKRLLEEEIKRIEEECKLMQLAFQESDHYEQELRRQEEEEERQRVAQLLKEEEERKKAEEEEEQARIQLRRSKTKKTKVEEVFENQRKIIPLGWSHKHLLPTDRPHYSTDKGKIRYLEDYPTEVKYVPARLDWQVDLNRENVDSEGWEYAWNFFNPTWSAKETFTTSVRRRRLVRFVEESDTTIRPEFLSCMKDKFLTILIIEARGLRPIDTVHGTSTTFVEIRLKNSSDSKRTKTIERKRNPVWNEVFVFAPKDIEHDVISIKVYHHPLIGANILLGELELPVSFYCNKPPVDLWRQLQEKKSSTLFSSSKGHIHFQLTYSNSEFPQN